MNLKDIIKPKQSPSLSIGLDIGSSSVKVVKLKSTKEAFELIDARIEPCFPDIESALKNIASSLDVKDVAISISGPSAMLRYVSFPKMQEEELERSLHPPVRAAARVLPQLLCEERRPVRRRLTFPMLAVLAAMLPASCARPRPSVLLVSIDSLRYDDAFGTAHGRPVSPRVAALAQEGLVFDRAYSTAPWTTPSMMSVMTGMDAEAHGMEEHDRALVSGVATLAERFQAAGYATLAFVPEVTLRPQFGFGRGFDNYDLEFFGHARISSPALTGKLMNRLDALAREGKPFFAWVHLWDPHYNYNPP